MEHVKLSEFTPDPKNANKGTVRGRGILEKSLQDLGAGRSILVDKHGTAIAGNKTLSVAIESGFEDAIVVETDGTRLVVVKRTDLDLSKDEKAKLLAVGDNRASEIGLEWDVEVLAELNQKVDLSGFFFPDELANLLASQESGEGSGEEDEEKVSALIDEAESGAIESRVSLGQVWKLGRHTLCCGDSTSESNIRNLIAIAGCKTPSFVFCDPPYGVEIVASSDKAGGGEAYDIPFGGVKNRKGYVGGVTATEPQSRSVEPKKPKGLEPPMVPSPLARRLFEAPSEPRTL